MSSREQGEGELKDERFWFCLLGELALELMMLIDVFIATLSHSLSHPSLSV